jgi:hypothetical protein
MDRVSVDLTNCYGIKRLKWDFDFCDMRAFAIYAPNGAMKSSLAQTFLDVATGDESADRIFPKRKTTRLIVDENGRELDKDSVFVVLPYNDKLSHTERTSTLLVNAKLRGEYTELHLKIDKAREALLQGLAIQSRSRRNFDDEISLAFTGSAGRFQTALTRIKKEVQDLEEPLFADVEYDKVFDSAILDNLDTSDVKSAIEEYVRRYNELLAASTYFKKGTFDYYNAGQIATALARQGFFKANHSINLNANGTKLEITTQKELEDVISKEKDAILKDKQLRKRFDDVAKLLNKNAGLRDF